MDDIGIEELKDDMAGALEDEGLAFTEDEHGNFFIAEGLDNPALISVMPDATFIKIFSLLDFRKDIDVTDEAANHLVNRMATEFIPNGIYQGGGQLMANCFLPCNGGFEDRHFIMLLRRSMEGFVQAARACDSEGLLEISGGC